MAKLTYFVKKRIGKDIHQFMVEGKDLHEVVMESKKLSFGDVEKCGLCGSDDLELSAHVTEGDGFDYTYIRCRTCRATLNFGQQKKKDDVYYLRTVDITQGQFKGQKAWDWKPYVANNQ